MRRKDEWMNEKKEVEKNAHYIPCTQNSCVCLCLKDWYVMLSHSYVRIYLIYFCALGTLSQNRDIRIKDDKNKSFVVTSLNFFLFQLGQE